MSRIACTGAIWSVLRSSTSSGTAMPVWLENGCIRRAPAICRTSAMRPAMAVAAAVAGLTRCVRTFGPWRCSKLRLVVETHALARLAAVAVAAGAHRAAGLAPEEAGVAEHPVEARGLRLALHRRGARHHHGDHAFGDLAPAHDVGGDLQVRQARVGAGADEHAIDRQARQRHAGLQVPCRRARFRSRPSGPDRRRRTDRARGRKCRAPCSGRCPR